MAKLVKDPRRGGIPQGVTNIDLRVEHITAPDWDDLEAEVNAVLSYFDTTSEFVGYSVFDVAYLTTPSPQRFHAAIKYAVYD